MNKNTPITRIRYRYLPLTIIKCDFRLRGPCRFLLLIVFLPFLFACQYTPKNEFPDPMRFVGEIEQIKKIPFNKDKERFVFTGSSSIRMWKDISAYYPEYQIINSGFGGAEMNDLLFHLEHTVLNFAPAKVFIYGGDNDVGSGRSISLVLEQAEKIAETIESKFPDCQIIFISAKPSVLRWHLNSTYEKLNQELEILARKNSNRRYVDIWEAMLNDRGVVNPSLFLRDGLHMNNAGYNIWSQAIRPFVES